MNRTYPKIILPLFILAFLLLPSPNVQADPGNLDIVRIDDIIIAEQVQATDIQDHWAQDSISKLIDKNAISGYPDGTFKPDKQISRAEFATILVKAFDLEKRAGQVFNDTAEHWGKDAIATANAFGIVNGYSDTTFGPDDSITREQMAVMIVKAAKLTEAVESKTFADSQNISDWAKSSVDLATGNNLITGYEDNSFKPQGNTTRAEAATVIIQAIN